MTRLMLVLAVTLCILGCQRTLPPDPPPDLDRAAEIRENLIDTRKT